ncbi:rubredoxin [Mucilaginibacter sp.]|jgi:rubredoxin|uniref:rubredoxin n=1 Tax=Mucilaginibacter sp. TaxID=1882438 RepID=UPI0035663F74
MEVKNQYCIKINLPGGVASAGDMYEILIIASNAGATTVSIGNRQQLFFYIDADRLEDIRTDLMQAEINYEIDKDDFPNILSSYVTDAIFNVESWIKEGVYKDIFDLFDFVPRLKINLVDNNQTFVPFFSGNLNFITSNISNYWFLYIRFPKTNSSYCWPSLIYSDDIPVISKVVENTILNNRHLFYDQPEIKHQLFFKMVMAGNTFGDQPVTEPLKLPDFYLPYYEGFNKYANNKYWLGVYRRNEVYPLEFLKDICALCLKTRVGQLYTTPWKSLLIKGINEADRAQWGAILNKYRVNIRHAANELNWQLENLCSKSLELKKQLVREFEEHDLRTYRLGFAIKMQPKTGLPGSIIIRKQRGELFDILHSKDFNPNSKDLVNYKDNVSQNDLAQCLISLCNYYHLTLSDNSGALSTLENEVEQNDTEIVKHIVYQCKSCLTIYDKSYGDLVNGIAPYTEFESLIEYACPVCEASKENFLLVEKMIAAS